MDLYHYFLNRKNILLYLKIHFQKYQQILNYFQIISNNVSNLEKED